MIGCVAAIVSGHRDAAIADEMDPVLKEMVSVIQARMMSFQIQRLRVHIDTSMRIMTSCCDLFWCYR